jgi:hypothetical protein
LYPQIEIFGVVITEPATILTDYAVAVACAWFAVRLIFSDDNRQHFSRWAWGVGFSFVAAGLLLGGTNHGFASYLSSDAMSLIWRFAYYVAGLSMALFVAGTVISSVPTRGWRTVLQLLNALGFLIYAAFVSISDDSYLWVIIVSVVSLGAIALIQTWAFITQKSSSARWLISGVFVSFLGASIQQSGIDLHRYFNHNDLYHIVQMIGFYLLFRGAKLLEDQN